MLKGSIVAIATPFKDGKVDEGKLKELVEFQIKNGTSAILPCGTTGESPTLSHEEHERVIDLCIEAADKRVPVMAGTGSNSTEEAVQLTRHAAEAGADAALVVTPYYNKPTQEGLYRHFKAVADSVDIPIILYNIPGRTSRNIEPETMARLAADCQNIIGVKEAAGSLAQMQAIKMICPDDFLLFSGDDALTLPLLSIGGVGVVSVVANIVPQDVAALIKAFNDGDITEAQKRHYRLLPLVKAMFVETNPAPVKEAMEMLDICSGDVRLPMCRITDASRRQLRQALVDYGLLKT
ncbi:MAG: 4-hydroxy-tetrahydrodipicolinate synthase [Candidatus Omnitrophota bacterium]